MTRNESRQDRAVGAGRRSTPASASPTRSLRPAAGVLATAGVALLAFDDVHPLRALGGGILASPGWIPILLAGLLAAPGAGLRKRRPLVAGLACVLAYGVALTVVTLVMNSTTAYGERPLEKAVRVVAALGVWLAALAAGWILARTAPRHLLVGAALMFCIMLLGAVPYHFGVHIVDDLPLIHSGLNTQQRVRSTRFEASSLGAGMLVSVALMVVLWPRPRGRFWICLAGLVLTVLASTSRGTELIGLAGVVLLLVFALVGLRVRTIDRRLVVAGAVVAVVVAMASSLGLAFVVQSAAWHAAGLSDAGRGTSDATRAGWASVAVDVLVRSPLGLGLGSYLQQTPALLDQAVRDLSGTYGASALTELRSSASGISDVGVSPKTAPTLAAFHLGWPGVIALAAMWTVVLVRAARSGARSGAVAAVVIAGCVIFVSADFYSSFTSWDQAVFFGVVLGCSRVVRASGRALVGPSRSDAALDGPRRPWRAIVGARLSGLPLGTRRPTARTTGPQRDGHARAGMV